MSQSASACAAGSGTGTGTGTGATTALTDCPVHPKPKPATDSGAASAAAASPADVKQSQSPALAHAQAGSTANALEWSPALVPDLTAPKTRPRVLLAVSGSVATIKVYDLLHRFTAFADVRVITTAAARHFFDAARVRAEFPGVAVYTDDMEYSAWRRMNDPVLHIELRKWADALVVAPISANTLAKLANGLSDNLLTCVARAWDVASPAPGTGQSEANGNGALRYPLIVAPAMNTLMWSHPFTAAHLTTLRTVCRALVVEPVSKKLACGDIGTGALAAPDTIADAAYHALRTALAGQIDLPPQRPLPATTVAAAAAPASSAAGLSAASAPPGSAAGAPATVKPSA